MSSLQRAVSYRSPHVEWQVLGVDEHLHLRPRGELQLADGLRAQPGLHDLPGRCNIHQFILLILILLLLLLLLYYIIINIISLVEFIRKEQERLYLRDIEKLVGVSPFMIQGISTMIILAKEIKSESESVRLRHKDKAICCVYGLTQLLLTEELWVVNLEAIDDVLHKVHVLRE